MRNRSLVLSGAFVAALTVASSAQAGVNLVQDGGFESPAISTWYANYGVLTDSTFYDGALFSPYWSIPTNNIDLVSGPLSGVAAYEGTQFLDLVGYGSTGAIAQSLATTAGKEYRLTFAYANNPWSTSTASALVSVTGASSILSDAITHNSSNTSDLNWTLFTTTFIADSSSASLMFANTVGSNNGGVMFDAVSVSAVPEPATWAMMLLGFAGLGLAGHRRVRKNTAAFSVA